MVPQLMRAGLNKAPTLPSRTQLSNLQTENCSPKREKKVEKILDGPESMRTVTLKHPGCCSDPGLRKPMVLRALPGHGDRPPHLKGPQTLPWTSVLPTEEAAVYKGASR